MKLINMVMIIIAIVFVIGAVLTLGMTYYWIEYDKVNNVNGNFLPYVNLSRSEFKHRGFVFDVGLGMIFCSMGGFLLTSGFKINDTKLTRQGR